MLKHVNRVLQTSADDYVNWALTKTIKINFLRFKNGKVVAREYREDQQMVGDKNQRGDSVSGRREWAGAGMLTRNGVRGGKIVSSCIK